MRCLFLIVLISITLPGKSQSGYSGINKLYEPIRLPVQINNPQSYETFPLISRDDSTMFFVRRKSSANKGGKWAGQDIWISHRDSKGHWQSPSNDLKHLNNEGSNAVVGIAPSGNKIWVLNDYKWFNNIKPGVSVSHKKNNGTWSKPDELDVPGLDPKGNSYGLYMHPSGEVLLISMRHPRSLGGMDIFISTKDNNGDWSKPIHLPAPVNSINSEISPFLTQDKQALYFSSSRRSGFGRGDIYVCRRQGEGWKEWSDPENMGTNINSRAHEAYPFISNQGYFYFVSDKKGNSSDIYVSRPETQIPEDTTIAAQNKKPETKEDNLAKIPPNSKVIYFDAGSSKITDEHKQVLKRVVRKLNNNQETIIVIAGHTDNKGKPGYSKRLSVKRARGVAHYLKKKGISKGRMIVTGYGSKYPVASNKTQEGMQKNRRVEIQFKEY